jgi:hypothetical protein
VIKVSSIATKLDSNEVPAIEVKTIGDIFYVAPSLHKNGFPYQVIGIDTPTVSNNFPKHIDNILNMV